MKTSRIIFVLAVAFTMPLVAAQKPTATTTKNAGDPAQRLAALKANFPGKRTIKVAAGNSSIQVEVPHGDTWSNYRGAVVTTTLQSIPASVARMEKAIEADIKKFQPLAAQQSNRSERAQAEQTIAWLNRTLRPYLAQLRALTP